MRRLHDRRARALIIVNQDTSGDLDAIDPWSLCQASVAHYRGLKVFVWRTVPSALQEQLELWDAKSLHEDIQGMPWEQLRRPIDQKETDQKGEQLTLFDIEMGIEGWSYPAAAHPLLRPALFDGYWSELPAPAGS